MNESQRRDNALQMVQCKVLKQLDLIHTHKYDDEDFVTDIQFISATLQENVADLRWPASYFSSENCLEFAAHLTSI